MNDLERRVRDLLHDDASLAPLTGPMPAGVRPKVRRRQAASTALVAMVAIAVLAGSIAVIRNLAAVRREIPVEPSPVEVPVVPVVPVNTQPVFDRTTTIGGLEIDEPERLGARRLLGPLGCRRRAVGRDRGSAAGADELRRGGSRHRSATSPLARRRVCLPVGSRSSSWWGTMGSTSVIVAVRTSRPLRSGWSPPTGTWSRITSSWRPVQT